MTLSVIYAGTPEFAVPALSALVEAGYDVRAVYSQPDRPAGRGRQLQPPPVKQRALALGLPVLQPQTLRDAETIATLAQWQADVMVVAAYGLLLPPAALAVPRFGCLNIHASLLPRWRGAAPVQRALLAGDACTGIGIMQMEAGLDTGPVFATREVPIGPAETTASLTAALADLGARTLVEVLPRIVSGELQAVAQRADGIEYAHKVSKAEASVDWRRPAIELDRVVRAFQPWPVAETRWRGAQLRIHEAVAVPAAGGGVPGTVVASGAAGIDVATGEGVLRLQRVQAAGRGVVAAREYALAEARHGLVAGARLGDTV